MILFPNAKINIGLDILRKRSDGYHDISTVMYPIGWTDILEIVPNHSGITTLTTTGRAVNCPNDKNLVIKAYDSLNNVVTIPSVDIYLHKVIPDGAGLGGGSADAAFTLIGLNKLFSLNLSEERLATIAAGIGADCAFFIYNRPMLCEGIGTEMSHCDINLTGYHIAVIKPNISIPTAQAYAQCTPHYPTQPLSELLHSPIEGWQKSVQNGFETGISNSYPEIQRIKDFLISIGAKYASMSGSGSAVYGLFECDILADSLHERFPNYDIFVQTL
jgi:4-diphosphocytidyl-2-C-methyl-D-erythritol kinase